jgi:outer membrane receptor for ferrienterochelin and colicin
MKSKQQASRRHHRSLLACALASCMLVAAPQAFAQSTAATIRGQVSADSAPAGGASVTATNVATGLTRSVQSTANGSYSLGGLPPGTYRIDVTANGQKNSQNITVQVGQTATLNLGVGGTAETAPSGDAKTLETVSVTATAAVETKTSEIATYVTQKQIDALPQGSRNFLAFADTVPGMVFETGANGSAKLRSGGQNSNGINVYIDGVGQKSYVTQGGIGGQTESNGNPFPQLAIGEYKVITSNYKAEYDQISSAAVTAVTKSGTNEFHGSMFWDNSGIRDWREPTPAEEKNGKNHDSGEQQYGAALGGPIVQDKLFFFVTYEAKDFTRPREVRTGLADGVDILLPPEIQSQLGGTTAPFNEDLWFGKLTWQAGDANLFELSAKLRDESEITDVGDGPNAPSYGKTKNNNSKRYDLRYQYSGVNWLNDAHLTFEDEMFNPRAITIGPGLQIKGPNPGRAAIVNLGGGQDYQNKGQKGVGFQDDLTFTGLEGHTMKMGFKYKSVEVNAFEQQPYNPQYEIDLVENLIAGNDFADFVPNRVRFGAPLDGQDRNISSTNKQYGIYFQDDWEVTDKLLLNLGLRYDYERSPGYENYETPAGLVTALRNWSNLHNANVDYNIEDYISNGNNRKPFKNAWQPRLGFSYDLFADQRHVIFGGAGRAYDRNLFDYIALEQSKSTFPSYTLFFNTPDNPCTVGTGNCYAWDPKYYNREELYALVAANPNLGSEVNLIKNDIKVPYSDQLSIGMRNTLTWLDNDWNTSVALAHIESHDGILFSLGNRRADGTFFPPGVSFGSAPFGFPIPGYGSLIIARNGVETRINQLLLSIEKPYSKSSPWGVTIAYTYSDSKENRGNAANSDEHYSFDYPDLDDVAFVKSVGISKHRLVATGIADFWGMTASAKLTLASPPGNDGLNCFEGVDPGACDRVGRFDTYYFSGQKFRQLDLALQKEWDTGTDLKLRVRGDVFNVTNERNYTDFGDFKGTGGVQNPTFGQRTGDGIIMPTRTFKLSFGLDW